MKRTTKRTTEKAGTRATATKKTQHLSEKDLTQVAGGQKLSKSFHGAIKIDATLLK